MRDTTTFLRSQCDALRNLPPEQFKMAVTAIWDYEMDGIEPSDPIAAMAVGMAKPLIDKRAKRAEAGRKGGSKPKQTETNSKQTEANEPYKEESIKIKEKKNKDILSDSVIKTVIDYLNEKAGTSFRCSSKDTRDHVRARLNEGYTEDDFRTVIDKKVAEWSGTDMAKYLRPSTLFGPKFEAYLNQKEGHKIKSAANFEHSGTDWDALAAQIMEEQ